MAAQRVVDRHPQARGFCSCSYPPPELGSASPPMPRVRVCDDIPVFRDALSRELSDHGLDVVSCEPLKDSSRERVDLTVCGVIVDHDWGVLQEVVLQQDPVFVIVPEPSEDNEIRALALGAAGVTRRDATLGDIVSGICALQRGYMLIDVALLRRLCLRLTPEPPFQLSPNEREWLRRLAAGATISALARHLGYSDREMHRVMRRLYDRMEVTNLYQALIVATRLELLE